MIRIAAVGDIHYGKNCRGRLREFFQKLPEHADLFLIAGDLTQRGFPDEAEALACDLRNVGVPVVAVLGNHDYHTDHTRQIQQILNQAGVVLLEAESLELEVRGKRVGIAGLKGFGGGFAGACVTEFGEPEMRSFARYAKLQSGLLRKSLDQLDTEYRFVLLHYSPIDTTLLGEKKEIYPFLGSYLLAEAIDASGADCVFHGHAHLGSERGFTRGGIPVRNVAQPVIRHAYNVYTFDHSSRAETAIEGSKEVSGVRG